MIQLTSDLHGHEAAYLSLELEASSPYSEFVHGDMARAREVQQLLFADPECEFGPPYGRVLLETGAVAGMLACLDGRALQRCRLRATLVLMRSGVLERDAVVRRRTQLAAQTLLKPAADDHYLSRIAVTSAARGRGVGRALIEAFEKEARKCGARRLVLEVSPSSVAAVRLYEGMRYEVIDRRRVVDPLDGRVLEYLHMGKSIE